MKYFYIPLSIALITVGVQAALFNSTTNNQNMNISCYDNLKINAEVQAGGSIVVATGTCNIQSSQGIGKAGDIITDIKHLPGAIALGQIGAHIKEFKNIATPAPGDMARFSFATSTGLPIDFVIKRVAYAQIPQELKKRGLEKQAQELRANNPNEQIELLMFYRAMPGITLGWLDLGQDITITSNIAHHFNIAIDSLGKILISSPESKGIQLFNPAVMNPRRGSNQDITAFGPLITYAIQQIKKEGM